MSLYNDCVSNYCELLTFCNWKFTIFIRNRIYVIVIVSIVHGTLYACSSFSQPLQPPEPSPPKVHRVSYRGKGGISPLAPISPPFNNDWVSIALGIDLFLATFSGYFSHFLPLLQNPVWHPGTVLKLPFLSIFLCLSVTFSYYLQPPEPKETQDLFASFTESPPTQQQVHC